MNNPLTHFVPANAQGGILTNQPIYGSAIVYVIPLMVTVAMASQLPAP